MEQSAHQGQLNFKVPLFDPVNRPPREIHINIFMCPEDTESPNGFVEMGSEKYAMASYVASFGPPDLDDTQEKRDGLFSRNSGTRFAEVTDGLSNTLACGERQNGPFDGPVCTDRTFHTRQPGLVPFAKLATQQTTTVTWCYSKAAIHRTIRNPTIVMFPPTHIGYANFLMGDGSVSLIVEQIDFKVYQSLSTRSGTEAVTLP